MKGNNLPPAKKYALLIDENISCGGGVRSVIESVVSADATYNYLYLNLTHDTKTLLTQSNVLSITPFDIFKKHAGKSKVILLILSCVAIKFKKGISVIYAHQPTSLVIGVVLGYLMGVPVVYHCHGLSGPADFSKLGFIFKLALKKVDRVIAISKFVLNQISLIRVSGNSTLIYNWADCKQVVLANQHRNIDYLFIGRICRDKSPHSFVNALKALNYNYRACIIGPAEDMLYSREVLSAVAEDGRFEYVGLLDHQKTLAMLETSKVLIVPSRWGEPFGLVILEAMIKGVLVIARRDGAIPEIITHGVNGLLFDNDDELVNIIKELPNIDFNAINTNAINYVKMYFNGGIQVPQVLKCLFFCDHE